MQYSSIDSNFKVFAGFKINYFVLVKIGFRDDRNKEKMNMIYTHSLKNI